MNLKGYTISLEKIDNNKFYISVMNADGGYLYDGYWKKDNATFKEALHEALSGAELEEE